MIFVTVGSAAPFDELIMKMDEIADKGAVDMIISQIGDGSYVPQHGEWYRFKDNLMDDYKASDLIITHTGAGTLFEIVRMGKKAIAIPNPHVVVNHDLAEKLSKDRYIIWCPDLAQLEEKMANAKSWEPVKYETPPCKIPDEIMNFLAVPR